MDVACSIVLARRDCKSGNTELHPKQIKYTYMYTVFLVTVERFRIKNKTTNNKTKQNSIPEYFSVSH